MHFHLAPAMKPLLAGHPSHGMLLCIKPLEEVAMFLTGPTPRGVFGGSTPKYFT